MTKRRTPPVKADLKVLFVVPSLFRCGPIKNIYNLAKQLVRMGICPDIATIGHHPDNMQEEFAELGINIENLRASLMRPFKAIRELKRKIVQNDYSVVHSTVFWPDLYCASVRKSFKKTLFVSTVQSMIFNDLRMRHGVLIAKLVTILWIKSLKQFDKVAAFSDGIQGFLSDNKLSNDKLERIYNSVDLEEFSVPQESQRKLAKKALGISEDSFVIGHVGYLIRIKGVDLILDAISKLPADIPVLFLSVGDGGQEQILKDKADRLRITNKVMWAGRQKDVVPYFYAMDVFTLPSRTEGLPGALLEACAVGLPAVVSDIPGSSEIVVHGKTGVVVPKDSVDGLAEAYTHLFQSKDKLRQMGITARQRIEDIFSTEAMAEAYAQLYSKFLGPKSPAPNSGMVTVNNI